MYKFWIYELIISKLMIQNISLLKYYSRSKSKDMVCFMWLRNEPSHLAGLFDYLFMFLLHRHLLAKQTLNSNLTAKWLGFISLSNIWTDHIFIFSSYLVLKWQVVHQKYRPNVMWQCAILLDYLIRLITSNNVIIDNA